MNTVEIEGKIFDLPGIENDCWQQLANAVTDYKDPFHNPVVANVNQHGVNLRTVVLRKVDDNLKQLSFYTDIRCGKWNELKSDSNISWIFYNSVSRIQIRLAGKASLHDTDEIADESWVNCPVNSRKVYNNEPGSSAILEVPATGLSAGFDAADPAAAESETGRKNFGVVVTSINWMEWLWLNSEGHCRAAFHYGPVGEFKASWLVP